MPFIIFSVFLIPQIVSAHPVTFQGGTMIKSMFREDMSETSVAHSFHRQLAAGFEVDTLQLGLQQTTWAFAEFNARPFRWNMDHAQANVYLLTGVGGFKNQLTEDWAGKAGIQIDYETREIFTMLKHQEWFTDNLQARMTQLQLGFAPFVAGYNDLNIWTLIQLDYSKEMRAYTQVTPQLRFFYKNVFWEMGASTGGNFYGLFMVHI